MRFPVNPRLLLSLRRWVCLSGFCFNVFRKLRQFLKKIIYFVMEWGGEEMKQRKCFDSLSPNALLSSPPRLLAFDLNSQIAPALLNVWFSAKAPLFLHWKCLSMSDPRARPLCLPSSCVNEAEDRCDADVGACTLVCCSTPAPSRCFPSPREAQKMRISEIAFFSEKLFANINIKPICMRSRPRTGKPSSFYLMHN